MKTVLDVLLETHEWQQLTAHPERVRCCHIFGEGNPLADSGEPRSIRATRKAISQTRHARTARRALGRRDVIREFGPRTPQHPRASGCGAQCDPAEAGGTAIRFVVSNAAEEEETRRPGGGAHGQAKRAKPASTEEEEAPIEARVATRGVSNASTLTRALEEESDEVDRRGVGTKFLEASPTKSGTGFQNGTLS